MRIYSQDIGMESGIEKCAMVVMKSGQRHIMEGVKLLSNQNARRKGNLQILGILEADTIKQVEMKEKGEKKSISEEPENYSRKNSIAGTLSKR